MAGVGPAHSAESERLAGLYALDLLEGSERAAYEVHLTDCAVCQHLVEQDRGTASYLSLLAPEAEPSPELRSRLMEAARSDLAAQMRPTPFPRQPRWRPRRMARIGQLAVAACLVLLLGMGVGYRLTLGQVLYSAPLEGPGGPGSEVVIHRSGAADVELRGLPDPPSGALYVVWLKDPAGRYEPLGTYDDGNGTCPLDRPVFGGTLVLTVEPQPTPPAPTGQPLLWATIAS